jgi:hypothetical protein
LLSISRTQSNNPEFEGKSISAWFQQLGSTNSVPAVGAFRRMTPVAIPYVVAKLKYHSISDTAVSWLKLNPATSRFLKLVTEPTERRCRAAAALRIMGPNAENALPALMTAWKLDPSPDIRRNAVYALPPILKRRYPDGHGGVPLSEWPKFEASMTAEAARRFPEVARRLGVPMTEEVSEPVGGSNRGELPSSGVTDEEEH